MDKIIQLMMALLNNAIFGRELNAEFLKPISLEDGKNLFALSNKHDLAHVIAYAISKNKIEIDEIVGKYFYNKQISAILRYENQNYYLNVLCQALENAKIEFIALKGSYLRNFYKEPWHRTCCDIDILIHKSDLEKATSIIKNNFECEDKVVESSHDIGFYTKNKVTIELHFDLIEENIVGKVDKPLENVWDYTENIDGYKYQKKLTNEIFYYYHLAHMSKHFLNGGCGVRPFIDYQIIIDKFTLNKQIVDQLINLGQLSTFAENVDILSNVWFNNKQHTKLTKQIEKFILIAGVYGNKENSILVNQVKKGSKFKYVLSKIWIPYYNLSKLYPTLKKHKWLYPFYQVRRWLRLIFGGRVKSSINEIKEITTTSNAKICDTKKLLQDLNLI